MHILSMSRNQWQTCVGHFAVVADGWNVNGMHTIYAETEDAIILMLDNATKCENKCEGACLL